MIFTRKAISPVVSTALLLVVAVVSVVGFFGWFNEFSSSVFVDVENDFSSSNGIKIEGVFNDVLYLNSKSSQNLNNPYLINSIKIFDKHDNLLCELSENIKTDFIGETSLLMNFDDFSINGNQVLDLSGNNNHGNATKLNTTSDDCISGSCVQFSTQMNETIEIQSSESLELSDEFTLAVWVNSNARNRHIIAKGEWAPDIDFSYSLKFGSSAPTYYDTFGRFWISETGYGYTGINSEYNLSYSQWYFIVGTFKDNVLRYYVDGELNSNLTLLSSIYVNNKSLTIGSLKRNDTDYIDKFDGKIDELSIYTKAITQEHVKILYGLKKAKLYEQVSKDEIYNFDINNCNIEKNIKYNILIETSLGLIERSIITK